jgi:hypothetical protein
MSYKSMLSKLAAMNAKTKTKFQKKLFPNTLILLIKLLLLRGVRCALIVLIFLKRLKFWNLKVFVLRNVSKNI